MTVTSIVPLDKRRNKILLDEDLVLVLYKGECRRYHIEQDGELSDEQYQEIVTTILFKRARERVFYLLKSSDKTEAELRRKLRGGYYPQPVIDHVIAQMKNYHYVNDDNYARNYLENQGKRKSKRQLAFDLQRKGISEDTVRDMMEECPVDEEELVVKLLKKKHYDPENCPWEERQKLAAFLGRKGFSYEVINRTMGNFMEYQVE